MREFFGFLWGVCTMLIVALWTLGGHEEPTPESRVLIGESQANAVVHECQLDALQWERFLMYDHTPLYAPVTAEGRAVMEQLFK